LINQGFTHAIGSTKYPAPQATLMATLTKGILSFNLDWQYVMVGLLFPSHFELCGIKALAFAIVCTCPWPQHFQFSLEARLKVLSIGEQCEEMSR